MVSSNFFIYVISIGFKINPIYIIPIFNIIILDIPNENEMLIMSWIIMTTFKKRNKSSLISFQCTVVPSSLLCL